MLDWMLDWAAGRSDPFGNVFCFDHRGGRADPQVVRETGNVRLSREGTVNRDEMIREIDSALAQLRNDRARVPSAVDLAGFAEALHGLRAAVSAEWPLARRAKSNLEALKLGVSAIRQLEGDFPELALRVVRLERLALTS